MTISKGVGTIVGCGVVAGLFGGVVGYLIGLLAPSAYTAVFPPAPGQVIEPTQVGAGLGVAQGLIVGVIVGVILVLVTWYEVRVHQNGGRDE